MKALYTILLSFVLGLSSLYSSVLVTNGLTHRHNVQGIDTETGYVVLKNIGDEPERVLVYFKDLAVGCNQENLYVDPGTTPRSNANWVKVGLEERILQPGEEFPMRYEIKVPQKNLTGSYWSLLMVEVKKPIDTTQLDYGVRVSSNVRYAVQIITDFNSARTTEVEFSSVSLAESHQGQVVDVLLRNFSEKVLIPAVKLEVYNDNGDLVLEKNADTKKLYPDQCRGFQVPIADLARGKYQGVLVADCGESDLFGMTLNLEVDE